ncbi:L-iditol 2-dehydrogenase [Thermohydrogenium kirishiense]|nr:L-iditol 2-dehydrogenase [Thermohydrogenium kirishiense]
MLALRLYGKDDLRCESIPDPILPKGGMIIKVEFCAICGSDIRNIKAGGTSHGMILPRVMGHEASGTIYQIDDEIDEEGYKIGERVIISCGIPCGWCEYCLSGNTNLCINKRSLSCEYDGCFAEYVAVPRELVKANGVIPIPDNISFEEASIVEPISCALNGQELSKVGLNDAVVIIGGGPIGIVHAILSKILGASKVILSEISNDRIEIARDFKEIDRIIDPAKEDFVKTVIDETDGKGADVVIVAAPSAAAQEMAVSVAAKRGRINFFGGLPKDKSVINIDSNLIHYKELFIHGTSDSTVLQFKKVLELIQLKKLNVKSLISKTFDIRDYEKAFEMASSAKALKVIIKPA